MRYGQWLVERRDRDEAVELVAAASALQEAALAPAEVAAALAAPGALRSARELVEAWGSDGSGR